MSRKNWTDEKIINRLINNKSKNTYWQNISELRKRPSKELFSKCAELLKSETSKTKCIGIDVLAQLGVSPRPFVMLSLEHFFDLLKYEKDPEVLMALLYGIGHNNEYLNQKQVEILCSLQNTDNEWVKEGLVSALGFIDDKQALDVLIKLSNVKLNYIRDWSTFYIAQSNRNNKKIRETLWNRVNDKHQETKLEAIYGLAKRNDLRVTEIIKRELLAGEYSITLFEAILETKNEHFLPLLRQNLEKAKMDKSFIKEWIIDLENCIIELEKLTKI